MNDDELTPDRADAITKLSADMGALALNAGQHGMHWLDGVAAVALTVRVQVEVALRAVPGLSYEAALALATMQTARVLQLPREVVKFEESGKDGPLTTGVIPVRRH